LKGTGTEEERLNLASIGKLFRGALMTEERKEYCTRRAKDGWYWKKGIHKGQKLKILEDDGDQYANVEG